MEVGKKESVFAGVNTVANFNNIFHTYVLSFKNAPQVSAGEIAYFQQGFSNHIGGGGEGAPPLGNVYETLAHVLFSSF